MRLSASTRKKQQRERTLPVRFLTQERVRGLSSTAATSHGNYQAFSAEVLRAAKSHGNEKKEIIRKWAKKDFFK